MALEKGDFRHWRGTVRVPVGMDKRGGMLPEMIARMQAEGLTVYYRDPFGLEVVEQFQAEAEIGPYWTWRGFLWVGKQPKSKRPACGAKTRTGGQCQAKAVEGRNRCRMHGGLSTGAKTAEGRAAIVESNRRRAELRRNQKQDEKTGREEAGKTPCKMNTP